VATSIAVTRIDEVTLIGAVVTLIDAVIWIDVAATLIVVGTRIDEGMIWVDEMMPGMWPVLKRMPWNDAS